MNWNELRPVCGLERIEISLADLVKEILAINHWPFYLSIETFALTRRQIGLSRFGSGSPGYQEESWHCIELSIEERKYSNVFYRSNWFHSN